MQTKRMVYHLKEEIDPIGFHYEMTNESQSQRLGQTIVGSPMPDFSGPWPPVPDSFPGF